MEIRILLEELLPHRRSLSLQEARALGLDAERVKQTYLERYRAARPVSEVDDEAAGGPGRSER